MRIAIVTDVNSFQIKNLIEICQERNHTVDIINSQSLRISSINQDVLIERLSEYDLVYYRNGFYNTERYFMARNLINKKVKFINSGYYSNPLLRYKSYQIHEISENNILVPITLTYQNNTQAFYKYLQEELGKTFIAKLCVSSKGLGVYKIDTYDAFTKLPENNDENNLIFQEYIENDGDYRVLVVGGKVAGIMHRIPKEGDFKANISQGGKGAIVTDEKEVEELSAIALKACSILNLEIAGIDIIRSKTDRKYYFIESNSSPQWRGMNKYTGINIGEVIIKYFEDLAL